MSSAGLQGRLGGRDSRPATDPWPSTFSSVLSKLVAGRYFFGSDEVAVEPVRQVDRAFSTLLHVRVRRGASVQGAFVKIMKPRTDTAAERASTQQNVVRDFEMTRRIRQALSGCAGLAAVRPIACFPEELALVTEEVEGPTLSEVLARRAAGWPGRAASREMSTLLRLAGAWLKAAQTALPEDRAMDLDAMRSYLDRRLAELETGGLIRLTTAGRSAVERYRDRLMGELTGQNLRPVWIHADFCPENIITGAGGITVLDFLMARSGTVYHDVAHLFMHLDAMKIKPWFRPAIVDGLQRDLLEGFEPGFETDQPLFALMRLQHVVCHVVALQAPAQGRAARLYRAALNRRHRRWLTRVAGLDDESWTA